MLYSKEIKAIESLYRFFNEPGTGLKYLIENDNSFNHFYKEYIGKITPLSPEQFFLFLQKASYSEIALAYQGIYKRCLCADKESSLIEEYFIELHSIRTIHLWFNNFKFDDMEEVFFEYPEFGKAFFSKVEQGATMKVVHAHSLFELFLIAPDGLKDLLITKTMENHGQEADENIRFSLDIQKQMEERDNF